LRIKREARKIAECTSYTPCVLLYFLIPKLNFVNRLLISKLLMSIKTDVCGPFPHCLSLPFQPMYSRCARRYELVNVNSSTGGWFWNSRRDSQKKIMLLFMSRLTNNSGLLVVPWKIVIESWITHASFSSQEVLLRKTVVRGSREERDRSQSVPLHSLRLTSFFLREFLRAYFVCPTKIPQPPFVWKC